MYFDPVTGAPATMPQMQFPTSQTAATPVDGGFTVGDYAKKKRLAEALRAKTGQGYSQMDPVGFAEGAGNQPGQAYINYGNILSNAMQPWLEGRREEKAAAAEDEAAAARSAALEQLMGRGELSAKDAVMAQEELGVDVSSMLPEKMNMAARAQASASRSGLNAMLQMKVITPEEHQAAVAQIEADEKAAQNAELEQIRAREAAQGGGRSMTELEYFRNDPEGYARFKAASGGGGLGGGAETATVRTIQDLGDKYAALKTSRAQESEMDSIVNNMPDASDGVVGLDKDATIAALSGSIPLIEQAQSVAADRLIAYVNNQLLSEAAQQKGVLSETDMMIVRDSMTNLKKNPASVKAVWADVKKRLDSREAALSSQLGHYSEAYGGQFAESVKPYYTKQSEAPVVPSTLAAPAPTQPTESPEQRKARLKGLL